MTKQTPDAFKVSRRTVWSLLAVTLAGVTVTAALNGTAASIATAAVMVMNTKCLVFINSFPSEVFDAYTSRIIQGPSQAKQVAPPIAEGGCPPSQSCLSRFLVHFRRACSRLTTAIK